jgi:hypothetical protein
MARTTAADVEKIIQVDSSLDVDGFIDDATTIVDEYLTTSGYSDALLEKIEKYLAAHLCSMRQRQVTEETFGDAGVKYAGKFGLGLDGSQYGQQVQFLDKKGLLSAAGKSIVMQAL